MTPRIYSQEVHHCMFCPNVSHDKSMCMALGLNQRRAVPVHGTPDWCELPTQTPRWEAPIERNSKPKWTCSKCGFEVSITKTDGEHSRNEPCNCRVKGGFAQAVNTTQDQRWATFAATVPDELYKSEPAAPSPQPNNYNEVLSEYNEAIRKFIERKKEASLPSLCDSCLRANTTCPVWEPGKMTSTCVEYRKRGKE